MSYNTATGAAHNGFGGDLESTNRASQLDQLLGTSNTQVIYPGLSILSNVPTGNGQHLNLTSPPPSYSDRSQPFVMPVGKTSIGRITLPVQPQGNGSDLQFILCPDNGSGSPNLTAPICSTVVPASWTNNITLQGSLTTDVPPLVTTQYNAISLQNNFLFHWTQPAIGPGGAAQFATPTTSDSYMILSGGYTGSAASGTVATIQSLGGGFIGNPTLQPSIPQPVWYHMMCATDDSLVVVGGTDGINFYKKVWTASWDSNTGTVGAWTAQPDFPVNIVQGCAASWGNYVYVIGGNADLTPASSYSTVRYVDATNGQIQSWNTANPLPVGLQLCFAAAINGWLVVCGGQNSAGTTQNKTYYAQINSDGSLGSWYTGQNMPVGCFALGAQWSFAATEDAMVIFSGLISGSSNFTSACQTLPVMTNSVGTWWLQDTGGSSGAFQVAAFPHGEPGNWQLNVLENTAYLGADTLVVPMLSVPLPATGLTPGNTYHVVIHNLNENLNDYTQLYVATNSASSFSPYVLRARYTNGPWTVQADGFSIPITIYDNTSGGSQPIHLWQDPIGTTTNLSNPATSASTYVYDFWGRLLGYCDAVTQSQEALNSNPLTGSSTSPWTVVNGTLTASTAQTHNGYADSGLLTPNGSSAIVYAFSELIRVMPNEQYTASAWLYMTSSYTDVSMSVNWYDSTQAYMSTSSNSTSIGAATWTLFSNVFAAPAGAAYATLVPTLGSTPSAGNPLYISYAAFRPTDPSTLSSVAEMDYTGTNLWPPTGVTQLN